MGQFENAFSITEGTAATTLRATNNLASLIKQMQKAAQQGNITALKRSIERLKESLGIVQTEIQNASNVWMMTEDAEDAYLANNYIAELHEISKQSGLQLFERDGTVVAYPSKLVVLPKEKAIRLDGKKVSTIRPSYLVKLLLDNQQKKTRSNSQQFLESLYKVYRKLAGSNIIKTRLIPAESVIALTDIYEILTALPGLTREYDRMDFARDLYFLDHSGLKETRNGSGLNLDVGTGAKTGKGTFIFVDQNGEDQKYHSIQFIGGS